MLLRRRPGRRSRPVAAPAPTAGWACQAPFGNLFLDPLGNVFTCCVASGEPLGNVGRQRLPEIWNGARLAAVREAMRRHDLSLGCQVCERRLEVGMRSVAIHYEHLAPETLVPERPRKLELNLSNACNLRCVMCNGDYSSAIRVHEGRAPLPKVYDAQFFDDLEAFLLRVEEVQFTGGEPFLVPEYPRIWDVLADHNPDVRLYLTTNATQWNARVERALGRLRFNLNVSLDGVSAATYERVRVGADHAAVMRNLDRFIAYAREVGTRVEIYHCLMPQNHEEFGELLLLGDRLDVDVHVSRVEVPAQCSIEAMDDPTPVLRTFDRLAADVRPQLTRNAPVFDEQHRRIRAVTGTR